MLSSLRYNLTYHFLLVWLLPAAVFAQVPDSEPGSIDSIGDLIWIIGDFISALIPIAAAAALLGFFWGLAQYIFKAGDKEAKKEGKQIMIWGSIALFLISAIGGIISLLSGTLGFTPGGTITPPGVLGPNS